MIVISIRLATTGYSPESENRMISTPSWGLTRVLNQQWEANDIDNRILVPVKLESAFFDYCEIFLDANQGDRTRHYFIVSKHMIREGLTELTLSRDFFLEYYSRLTLNDAHVLQRPLVETLPTPYSQKIDFKFRTVSDRTLLNSWSHYDDQTIRSDVLWVIASRNQNETETGITRPTLVMFPIPRMNPGYDFTNYDGAAFPSISDVVSGQWDEILQLTGINHVWVSSVPPAIYSVLKNSRFIVSSLWTEKTVTFNSKTYVYLERDGAVPFNVMKHSVDISTSSSIATKITDPFGNAVGELPSDFTSSVLYSMVSIGFSSAIVEFAFITEGYNDYSLVDEISAWALIKQRAIERGVYFAYPLEELDVTSNAFSDYIYSGQRDLDIQSKLLSAQQTRESSELSTKYSALTNVGTAGTSALTGALMGSIVPGIGTAAGALAGLTTSLLSTGVTTASGFSQAGATYDLTRKYDALNQGVADSTYKSQIPSLTTSGLGLLLIIGTSGFFSLITISPDERSINKHNALISRYGYAVDEFYESLDHSKLVEGYWRMSSCECRQFYPEARAQIKRLFEQGVRLVKPS